MSTDPLDSAADESPTTQPSHSMEAARSRVCEPDGPLRPGESFGSRYRIIRAVGVGGMGAVYEAWDADLGITVAIKVIRRDALKDPVTAADIERRFKRELLLARQVTHKNVVRIHDLGDIDGLRFITMSLDRKSTRLNSSHLGI